MFLISDIKNKTLGKKSLNLLVYNYKLHEHMWNINHEFYYKRSKRIATYVELSNLMNIHGLRAQEVARKMEILFMTYKRWIRNCDKYEKSLSNEKKDNIPPWFELVQYMVESQKLPEKFIFSFPYQDLMVNIV